MAEITHQNLGNQIPLWPKAGLICSHHSPKVSLFTPSCDPTRRGHPSHPPKALTRHANTRAPRQTPPVSPPLPPRGSLRRGTPSEPGNGKGRSCAPHPCTWSGSLPAAAGHRGLGTEGWRGMGAGGGRAGQEERKRPEEAQTVNK